MLRVKVSLFRLMFIRAHVVGSVDQSRLTFRHNYHFPLSRLPGSVPFFVVYCTPFSHRSPTTPPTYGPNSAESIRLEATSQRL